MRCSRIAPPDDDASMTPLLTLTGAVSATRPKRRCRRWPAVVIAGLALGALVAWRAGAEPTRTCNIEVRPRVESDEFAVYATASNILIDGGGTLWSRGDKSLLPFTTTVTGDCPQVRLKILGEKEPK